jgi:5-methyltetrahydrofolate--homocysteine methyltransferase
VGLNCSLGPDLMYPFLESLSEKADVAISCYPNAGLPNPLSETGFDLGPNDMARYLGDFARGGLINIAGGCCGNTPEHIAAIAKALERQPPRKWGTTLIDGSYARRSEIESRALACPTPSAFPGAPQSTRRSRSVSRDRSRSPNNPAFKS